MRIEDTVAVVTGAASEVGRAVARELAKREVHGLVLVDCNEAVGEVANAMNEQVGDWISLGFHGDVFDEGFRKEVFNQASRWCGRVNVCIPIVANAETVRSMQRIETELLSPVLWAHEMIIEIAGSRVRKNGKRWQSSDPLQGIVIFMTPALSHRANHLSAARKSEINSAAVSLMRDAESCGVGCAAVLSSADRELGSCRTGLWFESMTPSIRIQQQTRPEIIAESVYFIIANASSPASSSGFLL